MAGKNTAVFGIYKNIAQAESAVDQIVEFRTVAGGGSRMTTFRCCYLTPRARKSSHTRKTPRPPKEQPQA